MDTVGPKRTHAGVADSTTVHFVALKTLQRPGVTSSLKD